MGGGRGTLPHFRKPIVHNRFAFRNRLCTIGSLFETNSAQSVLFCLQNFLLKIIIVGGWAREGELLPFIFVNALALRGAGAVQPCSNMAEAGPCTRKPHHPTVVGVGDDKLVVRRWASDKRPIPWSHTARLSIGDVFPEMQKTSRSEVDGPTHFLVLDVKCLGGVPGTCWSGVEWSGGWVLSRWIP